MAHQFSFIVTCYNLEAYIAECLESLVNQNYATENYEIICLDDGSTDKSFSIIESFKSRGRAFKCLSGPNEGLEKACNRGIRQAQYEWVIRVDGDDFLNRSYLSTINLAMQNFPGYDFYYSKDYFEHYSSKKSFFKSIPDFSSEEIFQRGDFFATGTVYRKKDLETIGLLPEERKNCGLENYAVILALLSLGKKGFAVPEAIFSYRRHETNMSKLRCDSIIEFGHELLARYGRKFVTNQYHPYGLKMETTA